MPSLRTEITEIVTGVGMLGFGDIDEGLRARPSALMNVSQEHWDNLSDAWNEGQFRPEFLGAFENGRAFLRARDGLRWRLPLVVEWKGPHRQPAYDFLPADLRVDHVYLVSCKYLSRILVNASPSHLFDRGLASRTEGPRGDWYDTVAPDAYRALLHAVRGELADVASLPAEVAQLTATDRTLIKQRFKGTWPNAMAGTYRAFSYEVATESCKRLTAALPTRSDREVFLWRLLRLNAAPYFVLGTSPDGPLRLRIGTPWDWRQQFELVEFDWTPEAAGQPKVAWQATAKARSSRQRTTVEGHIEIRWSHGKFCGAPEAKVYLNTPYDNVPGYNPLS